MARNQYDLWRFNRRPVRAVGELVDSFNVPFVLLAGVAIIALLKSDAIIGGLKKLKD